MKPPAGRGGAQKIPRPPGTTLGDPAPWAHLPEDARRPSIGVVRDVLAEAPDPRPAAAELLGGKRASAVLAPLYVDDDDRVTVVLTRRAHHLRSHPGELSFPGGGAESDDDSLWDTARRESQEEIGLDPTAVEFLGELHHLQTVSSRSFIVPYVGLLPSKPALQRNPNEVEAIVHVTLEELLQPDIYRQERWGIPGLNRPIHFFELVGDTLWGATASMLVDFLCRVTATD